MTCRENNGQTDGGEGGSSTTKVGCESVAHILQSMTDHDERGDDRFNRRSRVP